MFVIAASIYLYRRRNRPAVTTKGGIFQWIKDFAFVWILLGLLVLYVVSVGQGSYFLFASGNIVVEILLIIYVVRSGRTSASTTASPEKRGSSGS